MRVWDLAILLPNVVFLLLLACQLERAKNKLRATCSAIYLTFYVLVITNLVVSVIRCAVSMTVNAALPAGSLTDKVLWVIVRFFLLSTELSVVIFGLAFGTEDFCNCSFFDGFFTFPVTKFIFDDFLQVTWIVERVSDKS